MKKAQPKGRASKPKDVDEILPEYDFSNARRNDYASRYVPGSVVVVLDPDVAATFGSSKEANDALRALAGIIQGRPVRKTTSPRRSAS
jgi:hypothetical protein